MAINSVMSRRAGKSGGAGIGGILGTIGAAIAAPFTGGASLAAIPGILGAGSAIGTAVGGIVAPGQDAKDSTLQTDNAASRRLAQTAAPAPEIPHSQILEDSLKALHSTNDKNMQEQYGEPLFSAYAMAKEKERGRAV